MVAAKEADGAIEWWTAEGIKKLRELRDQAAPGALQRRCRKSRDCTECGSVIVVGRTYWACSACYDGSWSHYSICEPCWELLAAFDDDGCACFGTLYESLSNLALGDDLRDLTPEAQGHAGGVLLRWSMDSYDRCQERYRETYGAKKARRLLAATR